MPLHLGHDLQEEGEVPGLEPAADASPNEFCDVAFRKPESDGFECFVPNERLRLGRELGALKGPCELSLVGDRQAIERNSQDESRQHDGLTCRHFLVRYR